jgi:hypothetical protein
VEGDKREGRVAEFYPRAMYQIIYIPLQRHGDVLYTLLSKSTLKK